MYGQSVLTHPLMVEAIEDSFIPVLVYNNKDSDAKLLKRFSEPSWNNPVTRFLDSNLEDVIERKDGVWKIRPMAMRMAAALKAADREVPKYLSMLIDNSAPQETATFAMHCYWEGEGNLGQVEGVSNTRSAWVGNLEVVQVKYDPEQVSYAKLVETAQAMECASKVFAHTDEQLAVAERLVGERAESAPTRSRVAKLSDQKYYLRNTPAVRNLPLTKLQSTKVNARLGRRQSFEDLLSPRQLDLLTKIAVRLKAGSAQPLEDLIFPDDDEKLTDFTMRLHEQLELEAADVGK